MRKVNLFLFLLFVTANSVFAAGEINVQNVHVQNKPPFQYIVRGTVINTTPQDREVVLRAQVVMYDETAPKGDLPVRVLRKDMTIILRASEERVVELPVMQEGRMPDVRFRVEPFLRIRRQRPWLFPYEDLHAPK